MTSIIKLSDFRNHGDEGPYIKSANQDPFTRTRSASPARHADRRTDISLTLDNTDSRHQTRSDQRYLSDMDESTLNRLESQHYESRREESHHQPRHADRRSRSSERLVNGYGMSTMMVKHKIVVIRC